MTEAYFTKKAILYPHLLILHHVDCDCQYLQNYVQYIRIPDIEPAWKSLELHVWRFENLPDYDYLAKKRYIHISL